MAYLHGVETIDVEQGGKVVNVIKSGVIGLVGIAPHSAKNEVIMVTSNRDVAQFGLQIPGFTIPQALDVIFAQGPGIILVVNVFDETAHTSAVTAESHTIAELKTKLSFAPIGAVTILDSEGAATSFVLGTDYSLDEYGNFKVLSNAITNGTVLKFTYKKLNLSAVTASNILGTYDAGTNVRTGLKAFDTARSMYNINPKIIITPGFSSLSGVLAGLISAAEKFRGIFYIDAPLGTTVNGAIAGRGPTGTFNFNTSNKRGELLYPHLKKYDPATNENVNFPYSAFLAGVRAATDFKEGFWVSSSNIEINGAVGIERPLSAEIQDQTSDINILNEAGITTILTGFGTGLRTWGNRNASFPTESGTKNFTNIVRIDDVVSESLEIACLPYVDKTINQGLIDSIRETGNSFMRTLIKRGAILPGSKVVYNKSDNPVEELANGHITFEKTYAGATPAERITIKSVIDINLYANLS